MIDLHMHSRYSEDGEFTPSELVRQCDKKGIRIMSVTDHNCAKANKEAAETAKKNGITYIPGIEIDCIEAFSSNHSQKQAEYYYHIAQERNLFVTCGSDYHGKTKPSIGIGQHGCTVSKEDIKICKYKK